MMNATYQVIDIFQEALETLANYYPPGHFDTDSPRDYFRISSRRASDGIAITTSRMAKARMARLWVQ